MNNNDLQLRLHELADEMFETDYTDLRRRVDSTTHRIRRRRAAVTTVAGIAAVAVVAVGGWALASRTGGGASPATGATAGTPTAGPSNVTSPTASAAPAVPTAVPGTLVYLNVVAGKPITMTTVTDGVGLVAAFGMATQSDTYWLASSPDATRLAVVESTDPGSVKPGDLVIISAGGSRRTVAHNAVGVPVWMPDGQHVIVTVVGSSAVSSVVDVNTGATSPAQAAVADRSYLTWSANGHWLAYGGSKDVTVTAADGTGKTTASVATLPECQQTAGCPTSVQAVSDDGRYVALGHKNSDPTYVTEAHLVLDMRTGSLVDIPTGAGERIDKIWFRPDGGMIVRTVTNDGRYLLVLRRADGVAISYRDTAEQNPSGQHLVAYHP